MTEKNVLSHTDECLESVFEKIEEIYYGDNPKKEAFENGEFDHEDWLHQEALELTMKRKRILEGMNSNA